jgi:predicted transcriptional regulator of viral defense system
LTDCILYRIIGKIYLLSDIKCTMVMKLDLLSPFEELPYFTIAGFRQLLEDGETLDQRAREMLSRWKRAGHILSLKRGVYMTRRFYELHRSDPDFAPAVSAILVPQSYVSLEYVLQQAGILTEATYPVTAVTAKNARTIENSLGTFVYRHMKRSLYTGFSQQEYYGVILHRASVAKALFDILYLRPLPRSFRSDDLDLAEDLRLNLDEFSPGDINDFKRHVEISDSEKMNFILDNLRRTVWQP